MSELWESEIKCESNTAKTDNYKHRHTPEEAISGVNNLNTTNASTLSVVVTPDKADAAAKEYKVNFTKQAPSSDATLKNLVQP